MALTANYVPKYKGLSGAHPQLENSSVYDDGEIQTTQGRAQEITTTVTTPYTVLDTDDVVIVNVVAPYGGASFVVNLPVAAGAGRRIMVKNVNTQCVEVTPNGSDTIDGKNSPTVLGRNFKAIFVDYAANKWVLLN